MVGHHEVVYMIVTPPFLSLALYFPSMHVLSI